MIWGPPETYNLSPVPYFVHATGSISLIDAKTNVEIFNHEISEKEGSDFNSIEKAGINALKNLANEFGDDICDWYSFSKTK